MFACDRGRRCGADTKPLRTARLCHLRHTPNKVPAAPLQVRVLGDSAGKLGAEPAPAPVLSWAAFRALCEAPPLQARAPLPSSTTLSLWLGNVQEYFAIKNACA